VSNRRKLRHVNAGKLTRVRSDRLPGCMRGCIRAHGMADALAPGNGSPGVGAFPGG